MINIKNNKNKVLLVAGNPYGGAGTIVDGLREGFQERYNIQTDVMYHIMDCPTMLKSVTGDREYRNTNTAMKEMRLGDYSTIHTHTVSLDDDNVLLLDQKKSKESPLIYTAHSLLFMEGLFDPKNRSYACWFSTLPDSKKREQIESMKNLPYIKRQSLMMDKADGIIHMTKTGKATSDFFYPEYSEKSHIIYNGSDMYRYADSKTVKNMSRELREKFGGEGVKIITFTGRIASVKGIHDIASSFNEIKMKYPESKLVMVGEGDGNAIMSIIGPTNRMDVSFEGWVGDKKKMAAYYGVSDVVVLPSYYEPFGLTALESMMMGAPTVVGNVDGPKELFVEPMLAHGVRPGHSEDITAKVDYILSHPVEAKKNAEAAMERVTRFSLDNMVDNTMDLYRRIAFEHANERGN